jgi:hypothetical protein
MMVVRDRERSVDIIVEGVIRYTMHHSNLASNTV